MQHLQKIDIKIPVAHGRDIPAFDFMPVFQRWIQRHTISGTLIDVADYSHMHQGPGVILVAHEFNISMDYFDGEMGLMFRRKQPLDGVFQERLNLCLQSALQAAMLLEAEPEFAGRLKFDTARLLITANDRLVAPNDSATADQLVEQVRGVVGSLYDGHVDVSPRGKDPRNRLTIEVRAGERHEIAELLAAATPQVSG